MWTPPIHSWTWSNAITSFRLSPQLQQRSFRNRLLIRTCVTWFLKQSIRALFGSSSYRECSTPQYTILPLQRTNLKYSYASTRYVLQKVLKVSLLTEKINLFWYVPLPCRSYAFLALERILPFPCLYLYVVLLTESSLTFTFPSCGHSSPLCERSTMTRWFLVKGIEKLVVCSATIATEPLRLKTYTA